MKKPPKKKPFVKCDFCKRPADPEVSKKLIFTACKKHELNSIELYENF